MRGEFGRLLHGIKYWWDRRSLQTRLIAASILIVLIPGLIVSVYSFRAINETYIGDTLKKSENLLEMEQLHISNQVEVLERAAQLAISDRDVINYLTSDTDPNTQELIEFNESAFANLTRIQVNNPNIEHLRLFSSSRQVYEIWPIIFREDRVRKEPWFPKAAGLGDQELWVFQHSDPDIMQRFSPRAPDTTPKVSLLREMNIPAGHHAGLIQVDMLLTHFTSKTFSGRQDNESQMYLIDSDLELFTNKNNRLGKTSPGLTGAIQSRVRMLRDTNKWNQEYRENGKSYLLTYRKLEQIDGYLLNVVSLEGVLRDISTIRNMIIGANVGFIVLVTLIAYILNAFILKNLKRLTETMKKVRKGELNTGIEIRGGGEVGELAHHFNKLMRTINELIAQSVRKQALSKEAELRTLHNQIDSHFLYNTLENIKMLAEMENQYKISDALTSLGGMMRYNFKWSGEYVKLKDEIRHIQNYIEVMNIRFEEPVKLQLEIPDEYMELEVLKVSLQPIVENSVKHAWGEQDGSSDHRITIRAEESGGGRVQISITDNGKGIPEDRLALLNQRCEEAGHERSGFASSASISSTELKAGVGGIGLLNVHQRLRLFYGPEFGLRVESEEGRYTTVNLSIPKRLLTGGGIHHAETIIDRG
ncbi:sensor histidine kinase [Paenibacillus sp. J22TS3]|uniref:cache domain-containing sensor histidine kinase n=1 Tax=Paenibacillus sp. J22TS3 TaxID=2807192 RepID=UPI001B17BE41|nr:sensor histidine kinase [Paenibacillus sp. J22TS3]GIP21923.1 sensor histidine kinase [Paenibacillus sp. J22TS3]